MTTASRNLVVLGLCLAAAGGCSHRGTNTYKASIKATHATALNGRPWEEVRTTHGLVFQSEWMVERPLDSVAPPDGPEMVAAYAQKESHHVVVLGVLDRKLDKKGTVVDALEFEELPENLIIDAGCVDLKEGQKIVFAIRTLETHGDAVPSQAWRLSGDKLRLEEAQPENVVCRYSVAD